MTPEEFEKEASKAVFLYAPRGNKGNFREVQLRGPGVKQNKAENQQQLPTRAKTENAATVAPPNPPNQSYSTPLVKATNSHVNLLVGKEISAAQKWLDENPEPKFNLLPMKQNILPWSASHDMAFREVLTRSNQSKNPTIILDAISNKTKMQLLGTFRCNRWICTFSTRIDGKIMWSSLLVSPHTPFIYPTVPMISGSNEWKKQGDLFYVKSKEEATEGCVACFLDRHLDTLYSTKSNQILPYQVSTCPFPCTEVRDLVLTRRYLADVASASRSLHCIQRYLGRLYVTVPFHDI